MRYTWRTSAVGIIAAVALLIVIVGRAHVSSRTECGVDAAIDEIRSAEALRPQLEIAERLVKPQQFRDALLVRESTRETARELNILRVAALKCGDKRFECVAKMIAEDDDSLGRYARIIIRSRYQE